MKTVIKIENLSKIYRLGEVGTGTLSHDLNRFVRMNILGQDDPYAKIGHVNDRTQKAEKGELVAALQDINLEVKEGEVLGIIGKNGAGKSTLLKLLSRVTSPTTGSIKVKGRLASLLEVGTGFHPEMTGRENIYMNGTIMGMRKWEIDKQLDAIVDFAGVAKYLDTPTKRYSSGMTVRLGFAIAAHLEPEILVVDEVLAVGDAEFQKKAIGKMQDVSTNQGRTVLFVSHNMPSIRTLCPNTIWMQQGMLHKSGNTNDIIDEYLKEQINSQVGSTSSFPEDKSKPFQVDSIRVLDKTHQIQTSFECDEEINIEIICTSRQAIPGLYGWFDLTKDNGTMVLMSDTYDFQPNCMDSLEPGQYCFQLKIPRRTIGHGKYLITLSFTSRQNFSGFQIDKHEYACSFEVIDTTTPRGNKRLGHLSTLLKWEKTKLL
ncbi:ABC transporter ATP-binding protein [Labilibacter marinus]|uniref:ABC transporter ATP-binding protein n=1 Tax=Labilibacter marinus TaxID=1477105 RepID=UPI00094F99C6|nr:ABC transporter ATP-binding protein [Labilibacter marinus]